MFFEALEKLSPNDIRMLAAKGVPHSRVSDWKARRRVPTRPQAYALATVAGLDFDKLERELTAIEMEQDARKNAGFAMLLATVGKLYFSIPWRMIWPKRRQNASAPNATGSHPIDTATEAAPTIP